MRLNLELVFSDLDLTSLMYSPVSFNSSFVALCFLPELHSSIISWSMSTR